MKIFSVLFSVVIFIASCAAQKPTRTDSPGAPITSSGINASEQKQTRIIPGAERINVYLPLIRGKRVGIFANQTSMVGSVHLVDTLKKSGVDIRVIFGPEHGFRGTASAGEKKRFNRPSRSSCITCSFTRRSRVRFSSVSSSCRLLILSNERTRARISG